jgi:hypothetical protein
VKSASSRSFGLLIAAVLAVIAGLSYWSRRHAFVYWGGAALIVLAIALAMPRVLAPLKRLWLKLGHLLHVVISPVILTTVYVLVLVPTGAAIRLFGKDLLALKRDAGTRSYWVERAGGPAPESLKDQF